jgi:uncharacterized membrane protein YedE/YeeE
MAADASERKPLFSGPLGSRLVSGYDTVFYHEWPGWLGAILIAFLCVGLFIWGRPWGVVGGLRVWANAFFDLIGLRVGPVYNVLLNEASILTGGLLFGAVGAALMAKQFAFRMAPPLELAKGAVGGTLMGIGSVFAGGCNVGGFYTALHAMSAGGVAMMIGLMIGAYIGLKYLLWEIEKFPAKTKPIKPKKEGGVDWKKSQPVLGAAVLVALAVISIFYIQGHYSRLGGLLIGTAGIGFVMHRVRFCFVRAFRDPFMTGEAVMTRAVALSVVLGMIGFAALKFMGLRDPHVYAYHKFFFGSLVGGIIFGVGMLLAGGCGSGTTWRAAEGQIKLIVALLFFAASNAVFRAIMVAKPANLLAKMGVPVYLPDYLTYTWTVLGLVGLMVVWALIATWNEETDRFTVF